jgi:hypothetical protein
MDFDKLADEAERRAETRARLGTVSFWLGLVLYIGAGVGIAILYPKLFALGLLAYAGKAIMQVGDWL